MPTATVVPDFQALFEHAPSAYILVRTNAPQWTIAAVSDVYLAATHRRREEIIGKGTFDVFPESAETQRGGGAQSIRTSFERVMATGAPNELPVLRYDVARPDGPYEPRYWQLSNYPVLDAKKRVAFILHRIEELAPKIAEAQTLRRALEQTNEELEAANAGLQASARLVHLNAERARRLLVLATRLNQAVDLDQVADVILHEGMTAVGADAGSFSLVSERDDGIAEFEIIRTSGFADHLVREYHRFELTPGRPLSDAILTEAPVLVSSRESLQKRYPYVTEIGYEGFVAVPVILNHRPLAGICFSFSAPQTFDEGSETFLLTIGEQCAQALERARLYEARSKSVERAAFLADASQLLASTLDYETTLKAIAEAAVPKLGDWCAVDIITDPTNETWPPALSRLAVVHRDSKKKALGLQFQEKFPTDWTSLSGMPGVIRTGIPLFIPRITKEMLSASARNAEHQHMLQELGFTSVIIVPLIARGLTLGTLTLVMSSSERQYTDDDFALATDLGSRAAIAIDNARLLRDAQEARILAEHAQASAISANKAKSDFLATMSHEIRTPINAILGYEELLELELSGPLTTEQRAQLTRIRSSARHLLGLVNEVLDLAKIESGMLHVTSAQASAGETVDAALSLIRPQAKARGITVSSNCEGARDAVYVGDEARVRQVLTNLLSNAVKFTEPGGTVSVACVRHDPTAELRLAGGRSYVGFQVTDSGIGIAPEQIDLIFEPFTQVMQDGQTPYTRENSGTGLGLSISRQLAQLMGGEITVTSLPGRGSTFTFWIPTPPKVDVFTSAQSSSNH